MHTLAKAAVDATLTRTPVCSCSASEARFEDARLTGFLAMVVGATCRRDNLQVRILIAQSESPGSPKHEINAVLCRSIFVSFLVYDCNMDKLHYKGRCEGLQRRVKTRGRGSKKRERDEIGNEVMRGKI